MLNKFDLFYNRILNNIHLLNESIYEFSYKEFIEKSDKFNENGLILEYKNFFIDVPNESILYLKNNQNCFLNGECFKHTFKNSKHYLNIKNCNFKRIFISIFDFDNDNDIDKFNSLCFNINDDSKLNESRIIFKNVVSNLCGFFNIFEDVNIFCINSNFNEYKTLYHEISHFIQMHRKHKNHKWIR